MSVNVPKVFLNRPLIWIEFKVGCSIKKKFPCDIKAITMNYFNIYIYLKLFKFCNLKNRISYTNWCLILRQIMLLLIKYDLSLLSISKEHLKIQALRQQLLSVLPHLMKFSPSILQWFQSLWNKIKSQILQKPILYKILN